MRLNDTTRAQRPRRPGQTRRDQRVLPPERAAALEHAAHLSPTMLEAGFRTNVIPSEAEATLDVRALPDENIPAFVERLKKVANEPGVEIIAPERSHRIAAKPSSITTEMFRVLENAQKKVYPGAVTIPTMSTGASDKVFLQAKGVDCYGFGPLVDEEDGALGFGAHADQERLREKEVYRFTRFNWEAIVAIAAKN